MKAQTLSIIGLGRIGASIGLALKNSPLSLNIVGHDRDRGVMKQAREIGAVDSTEGNLIKTAAKADILILAEPFGQLEDTIRHIGPDIQEHTVVIDTAPLKRPVRDWVKQHMSQGYYVSCAPVINPDKMDDIRVTIDAASADLFQNSIFCLMPGPKVDDQAVKTAANLGKVIGGEPFYVNIDEYDIYMQALVTLPGVTAAATFRTVTQTTGWRDMIRFAGLPFATVTSPLMGEGDVASLIYADEKAALHWIDREVANLLEIKRWIENGDQEALAALMEELNIQREEWLHERRQNDWNEAQNSASRVQNMNLMQQMFGSLAGRRGQDDDQKKK